MSSSKRQQKGRSRKPPPPSTSVSSPERIRARNQSEARSRYVGFLQKSLSCVSPSVWLTGARLQGAEGEYMLSPADLPMTLTTAADPIYFEVSQYFRYEIDTNEGRVGDLKVKTLGYSYTLAADDRLKRDYIAWHWHPQSRPDPHMHVRGERLGVAEFGKVHLPSGRVPFEGVVRMAIDDLGVETIREDWREVLDDCESRFKQFRTWG